MFTLVKLIKPFFLPPTLLFVSLIGVFWFWKRRPVWSKRLLIGAIVGFYLFSIEPTAYLLDQSLAMLSPEEQEVTAREIDAIVVLGGGADIGGQELGGVSWRRWWHGIELFWEFDGEVPLLYVGGSGDPFESTSGEAELAKSYAIQMGIPEEMIVTDDTSRDTYENGLATLAILEWAMPGEEHRVLLVTSASHMLRASGVMEALDFTVFVSAADHGLTTLDVDLLSFYPSESWFASSTRSLHEWIGLAWYRATNRL